MHSRVCFCSDYSMEYSLLTTIRAKTEVVRERVITRAWQLEAMQPLTKTRTVPLITGNPRKNARLQSPGSPS